MALVALVLITAVWGVTFVQVKDAIDVYPLFAFLALRFAIASVTLAAPGFGRLRRLPREGFAAGVVLGGLLAAGYALQTEGLARTTVSSTGFITGLYVVLTPLFALAAFRQRAGVAVWIGVALATAGLAMLSGIHAGSALGDLLVLAGAAAYSLQIVLMERIAPRFDALALTLVVMVTAFGAFLAIAAALGDLQAPHGWTVWGALVVTGVFASALGFLIQTWAQRRTTATRTALAFTMEPVFTALFGYTLSGDRLGVLGWGGCAVILAGIVVAEPAAVAALRDATLRSLAPARRRSRAARSAAGP